MQWFINLILSSGESVVNIMLYNFLPVMVAMSGLMALLEYFGVLKVIQKGLSPIFKKVGIPGIGVIAAVQLTFISFAAPIPTLGLIDRDNKISLRSLSATMAMIFALAQANVTFLMTAYGLNLGVILLGSLFGSITAAALTWFLFARNLSDENKETDLKEIVKQSPPLNPLDALLDGGMMGMKMVAKAFPMLLFALIIVNILRDLGFIDLLNHILTPIIGDSGSPFLLAGFSKYIAGGTAMMGVTLDMIRNNQITALQFNMLAGFLINPMDLAGVAVFVSAGPRIKKVMGPALLGAICGIMLRGFFNLLWFLFL